MAQIVTSINDLASLSITVEVHIGWRARVAKWLLVLASKVGKCKCQVDFIEGNKRE